MCDPTRFAARYVEVLGERLGLSASVSKHDIVVEFDDLTLHIINTAPSDPEILRLYTAYKTDVPRATLEQLIAAVNSRALGAKLFMVSDDLFAAEAQMVVAGRDCLPSADHLAAVLPRVISMVMFALNSLGTDLTLHGIADATENVT